MLMASPVIAVLLVGCDHEDFISFKCLIFEIKVVLLPFFHGKIH